MLWRLHVTHTRTITLAVLLLGGTSTWMASNTTDKELDSLEFARGARRSVYSYFASFTSGEVAINRTSPRREPSARGSVGRRSTAATELLSQLRRIPMPDGLPSKVMSDTTVSARRAPSLIPPECITIIQVSFIACASDLLVFVADGCAALAIIDAV